MKETIVKQCKNHIKKEKSRSNTPTKNEEVPHIAVTHYTTNTIHGKSHTLPRCIDSSEMSQRLELLPDEKLPRLYHKSTKRKRKRDKISNMFSVAGEKKEVIRYELGYK